jgi:hypothetical protein
MFWTVTGLVMICFVTMAAIAFPVWAIVDVVGHPAEAWSALGRSQTTWILVLFVGTFVLLLLGIGAGLYYVVRVRPDLIAASAAYGGLPVRARVSRESDDPSDTLVG